MALCERGIARSREQAASLIASGTVLVNGSIADKPARLVSAGDALAVLEPEPYVSRGGRKLAAALETFRIDVAGRRCLDAGASTGGFTDCLLQAGAASVAAVDVGHGQLDQGLRSDPRVEVHERTDIREFAAPPDRFEIVVGDLSFISLSGVAADLVGRLAAPSAPVVLLVKPQFEVGRREASRAKGVIRDPALHRLALDRARSALVEAGAAIMGVMRSPITGHSGNVEFLVHAVAPVAPVAPQGCDWDRELARVLGEGTA